MTTEHKPLTAAELTRYDVITNGDNGMLPHPEGEYVKYVDVFSMLTPPADKTGSKGLVDGIKAISDEFGHNFTWMSKEQMTPIPHPPTDAALREAVDELTVDASDAANLEHKTTVVNSRHLRTLLYHVRAAQAPRLDIATLLPDDFTESRDYRDSDISGRIEWLKSRVASLRESEAEVWKLAAQAPRLTKEQREFLMHIEDCLTTTSVMWPKEKKSLWYCLRAAFPEAFWKEW